MPYAQLVISFYMQSLKQAARQLKKETYAVYLASRDQRVPWYARVLAGVTVAYAFSPIDLIPDFIPILGYLDDLIIVPLGIWLVIKMIPPQVLAECREKAAAEIERGKPINRTAAAVIIAIWIGLGILAAIWIKQIFKR
ncbi:YkvA family protein [Microcoleus sp. CAWBG51]|uniref:YkvA family protein n=1 Tax=unclassified Microcoleus TaxID=2642155 RepID=UPI003440BA7C